MSDKFGISEENKIIMAIIILFVAMKLLLQKRLIVVIKISRKTSRMFVIVQESLGIEVRKLSGDLVSKNKFWVFSLNGNG